MTAANDTRTVLDLLTAMATQCAHLLRTEGELARAEVSEKVNQVGTGLGLLVGGAILLIPALVVLLQAAVGGLVEAGLAQPWAALAIGGACLIIGLILLMVGISSLRARNLVPGRTIHQLQRDARTVRNQVRNGHDEKRAA